MKKLTIKVEFDNYREIHVEGVERSDSVADVIAKIRAQESIERSKQRLLRLDLCNRWLDERKTLEMYRDIWNKELILCARGPLGSLRSM